MLTILAPGLYKHIYEAGWEGSSSGKPHAALVAAAEARDCGQAGRQALTEQTTECGRPTYTED